MMVWTVFLPLQSLISVAETDHVKDYMELFTIEEINDLESKIVDFTSRQAMDMVIVTTNDTAGKSSEAYADDFYDENGYGVGADFSGLLLLINMDAREVWISTAGHAIDVYNDSRITTLVNDVTPYLSDANYKQACDTFLAEIDQYATEGVVAGQYRTEGDAPYVANLSFGEKALKMMVNPILLLIALAIAVIAVVSITLSNKGKVTVNNQTYEMTGSFVLTNQTDQFIREHLSKTKIQKASSGGSSTHSGSSGRSHGGGGGGF